MKDILDKLNEAIVVGNYPDDGSTGIASDDDMPPGNIVFGDKYKTTNNYFNRLTGFKKQYETDLSKWYWDEFENSTGMEDPDNYSETLDSMEERWPNMFKHIKKSVPEKERRSDLTKMKKEIPDDALGDEDTESADELEDSILISKIEKYLTESKVGQEILRQIKGLDKWALSSWGSKDFVTFDDGVQFDVRGSKFKGRVIIKLDKGKDIYNIEFGQVRKLEWKSKLLLKSIFAGDLVNILDQHVG
jgi:hypothetical protein